MLQAALEVVTIALAVTGCATVVVSNGASAADADDDHQKDVNDGDDDDDDDGDEAVVEVAVDHKYKGRFHYACARIRRPNEHKFFC